jgi:hypothetical protein
MWMGIGETKKSAKMVATAATTPATAVFTAFNASLLFTTSYKVCF